MKHAASTMTNSVAKCRRKILLVAIGVFLISLGVRLAFLAWRGPVLSPDSAEYITLAQNLSRHGAFSLSPNPPFSPSVRRGPLYPAFLAGLNLAGGISPTVVAVIQSFFDSGVSIIVLLLALNIVPLRWALAAAAAYALHPGAIAMTNTLLTETLYTALIAASVGLLVMGLIRNRLMFTSLSGVAVGLAILCRTTAVFEPLMFAGVLLVTPSLARRGQHAALVLGIAMLVVAPWTIRTSLVARHFVLVQATGASNFYEATRWDLDQKDQQELERRVGEEFATFPEVTDGKLQAGKTPPEWAAAGERIWVAHALQNIRANPYGYLVSRARTAPYLFLSSFDHFTGINESFRSLMARREIAKLLLKTSLLILFSLIPFLLGIVSLVLVRRNFTAALCAGVLLCTLLFHLPMWIEYRFWLPALPLQMVIAVGGAYWICCRCGKKRSDASSRETTEAWG